jgi:3-oxoacyl-[acyl-carrier-protein] synthase-3
LKYNLSIKAIETALPKNSFKISSLKKNNPTWNIKEIINKTGIEKIWYTKKNQTALDLGFQASKKILKKINKKTIDTLIYVTQSPEYFLPTTACILQHKLGLNNSIKAFDINLGCSGFVYALFVASSLVQNNMSKNILIVCADTYTKYIASSDRTNKTIFSDGASATVVSKSNKKYFGKFLMGTDGSGYKDLIVERGASRDGFQNANKAKLFMNGSKIFMFTAGNIPENIKKLLKISKIKKEKIKTFFFHQGSKVILNSLKNSLKLPNHKVYNNLRFLGNTVSSTIPFSLKQANKEKKIINNDLIVLSGFGVGLSWGSCIIKWNNLK